jgi:hypothetical protein
MLSNDSKYSSIPLALVSTDVIMECVYLALAGLEVFPDISLYEVFDYVALDSHDDHCENYGWETCNFLQLYHESKIPRDETLYFDGE